MLIEERQRAILEHLKEKPDLKVAELAKILYVSEPTIRRDLTELHNKKLITKRYGGITLGQPTADREIPFLLRENEGSSAKCEIGKRAAELIEDGMVVMLDGSTSAYHLVQYIQNKKDIIVVTSGAKTAVALAEANVKTFCTGGKMIINSYSYVGDGAEDFARRFNADILFFSCRGVSLDGDMSELSIEEASLRRVMFTRAKKRILLATKEKIGQSYFYSMGNVSEIDGIICEGELPEELRHKAIL